MLSYSSLYGNEVYSLTTARRFVALAYFAFRDLDSHTDVTFTATSEQSMSNSDQAFDLIRDMDYKYSTYEKDFTKLDGTFVVTPEALSDIQVGYWSEDISDDVTGIFSSDQVLTLQFSKDHTSQGITIDFDSKTSDGGKDFDIVFYDSSNNVLHTENVTNNDSSIYELQQGVNNYRKVIITFYSTINPSRRLKISEITFGVYITFDTTNIFSLDVLEEIDITSGTNPVNTCVLNFDNLDQAWNPLNPSGLTAYLQRNQPIQVSYGLELNNGEYEYKSMGIFYLVDWVSEQNSISTTFNFQDLLGVMGSTYYKKYTISNKTLYSAIVDIFTDFGLSSGNYVIDTSIQSLYTNGNITPDLTHREAIQQLALAGNCLVFCDRNGIIQIKPINFVLDGSIDFNSIKTYPGITEKSAPNKITVVKHTYTVGSTTEDIYKGTVYVNGTEDVWIQYTDPSSNHSASASGGTINSSTHYTNGSILNLTGTGDISITVTGKKYIIDKSDVTLDNSGTDSVREAVVENSSITEQDVALAVASNLYTIFSKNIEYEIDFRGNPVIECGDTLTVEDRFSENKNVTIIKQEFKYDGGLSANLTGRK